MLWSVPSKTLRSPFVDLLIANGSLVPLGFSLTKNIPTIVSILSAIDTICASTLLGISSSGFFGE